MDSRWIPWIHPLIVILLAGILEDVQSININVVDIPSVVKDGTDDPIILDCDYDMGSSSAEGLVIKWFINNNLLYQWILGKQPRVPADLSKYVDLTYKASDNPHTMYRAVKLLHPGHDLNGIVKCVISTHDDEKHAQKQMLVYTPEKQLSVTHIHRLNGNTNYLVVRCLAEGLYPQPHIHILQDKQPIRDQKPEYKTNQDGYFDVEATASLKAEELQLPTTFQCEIKIPNTNHSTVRSYVYNGGALPRLSILAVTVGLIAFHNQ